MEKIEDQLLEKELIKIINSGDHKAEEMFYQQLNRHYPKDFSAFVAQMISEHKIKRKDAIARSTLNYDYAYKLMNGNKKTKERDYIIAICMGIGVNLSQVQYAMDICKMPKLNSKDIRDFIISESIRNHESIYKLNETLERANFELLKVSPDMPTAQAHIYDQAPTEEKFKVIDSHSESRKSGPASFDFDYFAEIIIENQNGKRYYVQAEASTMGYAYRVFDEKQKQHFDQLAAPDSSCDEHPCEDCPLNKDIDIEAEAREKIYQITAALDDTNSDEDDFDEDGLYDESDPENFMLSTGFALEEFPRLVDTARSKFFKYYFELDNMLDSEMQRARTDLNDTANLDGKFRVGQKWVSGVEIAYSEIALESQGQDTVYLQVVRENGIYHYSASKESAFLWLEMGDLYNTYYPTARKPVFIIETTRACSVMGQNPLYVYLFNQLQMDMDSVVGPRYTVPIDMTESKLSCFFQQAMALMNMDELDKAIETLHKIIDLIDSYTDDVNRTARKISAYSDLGNIYSRQNRFAEYIDIQKTIYDLRTALPPLDEYSNLGYISVLDATISLYHIAQNADNTDLVRQYMDYAFSYVDKVDFNVSNSWLTAFNVLGNLAYYLEDIDLEESRKRYLQALGIAQDHQLGDKYPDSLAVLYGNYGWVLWYKFDSFESIGYYSRSLELLESMARKGLNKNLDYYKKVYTNLLEVYNSANMTKETQTLKTRLAAFEEL